MVNQVVTPAAGTYERILLRRQIDELFNLARDIARGAQAAGFTDTSLAAFSLMTSIRSMCRRLDEADHA